MAATVFARLGRASIMFAEKNEMRSSLAARCGPIEDGTHEQHVKKAKSWKMRQNVGPGPTMHDVWLIVHGLRIIHASSSKSRFETDI